MIRILFLGDVVGEPGRKAVTARLRGLREEENLDFVVVNGENAAGGRGITSKIAIDLLRAGAAVITTGDHVWDQREVMEYFPTEPRLLRPINYPEGAPGAGSVVLETAKGKVGVINAQGRVFMNPPPRKPSQLGEEAVEAMRAEDVRVILLDFHAEATSEKIAMGRALDGRVSLVVGTHTHVQTADEQIFPRGTAYLTDAGMCGPAESVLGREIASVVWRFRSGLPTRFPVAKGPVRICGVIVGVDEDSGHAVEVKRVDELFSPANQSVEMAESEAEMEQGSGANAAGASSGGS